MLESGSQRAFLESFPGGLREWHVHVSHRQFAIQQLLRQVVWPLALDFSFAQCVSSCPGILLDVVQTRSLLDRTPARSIFHVYVCINIGYWGKGGNSLNPIQASENFMILETNDCISSVPT